MIRLFRDIRRKLAAEKNVTKYLRYAIGEILLVVIGILIALQVNNWNEIRKQELRREKLILALRTDFETSLDRLQSGMENAYMRNQTILSVMESAARHDSSVSKDSLQYMLRIVFGEEIIFMPALSSYEMAVSTGDIELLRSPELVKLFSEFFQAYDNYKLHQYGANQMVILGSWSKLRISLGSFNVFFNWPDSPYPDEFNISEEEFIDFLARKEVFATMEDTQWSYRNTYQALSQLQVMTESILVKINEIR